MLEKKDKITYDLIMHSSDAVFSFSWGNYHYNYSLIN